MPGRSVLFLFVDGVGLAPATPSNPWAAAGGLAAAEGQTVALTDALVERPISEPQLVARALDATLGVAGLPQSATGQTTLWTGRNAARRLGRHVSSFPGKRLRELLLRYSLVVTLRSNGHTARFANVFGSGYFERLLNRRVRRSASVWAFLAGGVQLHGLEELELGRAVPWDIVGDLWSPDARPLAPEDAGARLTRLAEEYDFVFYETFLTDLVGHGRTVLEPVEVTRRLTGLVDGVLATRPSELTVLLTSDHGNFEDMDHGQHTRNPVPLIVWGPGAKRFSAAGALTDVAPAIASWIQEG